jgi:hypothetical protein
MKKFRGMIGVGRSDGTEGSYISIDLSDWDAAVHVITIKLSFENFAKALTSMQTECDVELADTSNVGKMHEFKEEIVAVPGSFVTKTDRGDIAKIVEAVRPFRVDGWEPRMDDFFNHHHWVTSANRGKGDSTYRISFYRWVEKDV